MPCDSGPSYSSYDAGRIKDKQAKIDELGKKLKAAQRMEPLLCAASRILERMGFDFDENPELSEWWDAHKKKDARREAKEAAAAQKELAAKWRADQVNNLMKKSISDLTDDERAILREAKVL